MHSKLCFVLINIEYSNCNRIHFLQVSIVTPICTYAKAWLFHLINQILLWIWFDSPIQNACSLDPFTRIVFNYVRVCHNVFQQMPSVICNCYWPVVFSKKSSRFNLCLPYLVFKGVIVSQKHLLYRLMRSWRRN